MIVITMADKGKSKINLHKSNCEDCVHYDYNDETGYYECNMDLDEDEMVKFLYGENSDCPYYDRFDEYKLGRPKSGDSK